jgi:pilus assembly protein CpaC
MAKFDNIKRLTLGTALAAALAVGLAAAMPAPAAAQQSHAYRPTREVLLSVGEGELVSLPRTVANVWTSNPEVADVQVNNPRQIGLFGKANGEATVIATAADGSVVYGAHVRVSQNISSVSEMLRAAMPGSDITVTNVGQIAVINGTVASPEDSAQAEQLVRSILNPGVDPNSAEGLRILPVNRLRIATPQQVMLKVTIAEVSRSLVREIGVNLANRDSSGGFLFGIGQGTAGSITDVTDPVTGITTRQFQFTNGANGTTLGAAGHLLGMDLLGTLNLNEDNGLVTTLAEPTLAALSGETASFLAGGEFPIPISQSLGAVTIEYKQYGVGLAFTPTVLENGRISLRVRPEVSQLTDQGSIRLNNFNVPALTTRRVETTVELGSGQSFMIAGLLRNTANNNINTAPFLGDLPVLGALFRSTKFQHEETELVIIVTPYLVKPVSNQIALPTDAIRAPTDPERVWEGQIYSGQKGPGPVQAVPAPAIGVQGAAAAPGFKL